MMNSNTVLSACSLGHATRARMIPGARRALAAALLLCLALPAHADDMDSCDKASGDEAIAACSRVIGMGGTTSKGELANVYNNRGVAKARKGDLDGALVDFNRSLALDNTNAHACFNRGLVKVNKDDADGAIADFDCAIKLDPDYIEAYINRGVAKGEKNDLDGVIADMSSALKLDNNNAFALFFRGAAKGDKNDTEGAMADLNRAIELNPKNSGIYLARSNVKGAKGDYDGALADANRAIELDPKKVGAYLNRGNAKHFKGDLNGAIADFNRAIELDPKRPRSYADRGNARVDQGDLDGAIADYNRAVELAPNKTVSYFERGRAYFLKGDYAAATSDLERAQQDKDENYAALWLYLARAHTKTDGKRELSAKAGKIEGGKWPAPVYELYLGRSTPESLRAAAKNPDPKKQNGQLCEANLYLAEWLLINNDSKGARPLLEDAAKQCPKDFVEYGAAMIELRRLAAKP